MRIFCRVLVVYFVLVSSASRAQIPTTDVANLIQNTMTYIEQVEGQITALQQLEAQISQIGQMEAQVQALSGVRTRIASLLDSEVIQSIRNLSSGNTSNQISAIQDILLNGGSGGGLSPDLSESLSSALANYPEMASTSYVPSSAEGRSRELAARGRGNQLASYAGAQMAQKTAAEISLNAAQLYSAIGSTQDLKESLDLNNKLQSQVLMALTALLHNEASSGISDSESSLKAASSKQNRMAELKAGCADFEIDCDFN